MYNQSCLTRVFWFGVWLPFKLPSTSYDTFSHVFLTDCEGLRRLYTYQFHVSIKEVNYFLLLSKLDERQTGSIIKYFFSQNGLSVLPQSIVVSHLEWNFTMSTIRLGQQPAGLGNTIISWSGCWCWWRTWTYKHFVFLFFNLKHKCRYCSII